MAGKYPNLEVRILGALRQTNSKTIPHFIGALGGKDLPLEQGNDNKSYTQLKAAPE